MKPQLIKKLEVEEDLTRIKAQVDPVFEIAEITDRVVKSGGKALLFENTGTGFAVLTNMFGTARRMELALGSMEVVQARMRELFGALTSGSKFKMLPLLGRVGRWMPRKIRGRGKCQQIKVENLDELPILKCWPRDGGRFITLPMVHTIDPATGARNVGMYRMQVVDGLTTGMHWHVHKTGERHFRAWQAMSASLSKGNGEEPVSRREVKRNGCEPWVALRRWHFSAKNTRPTCNHSARMPVTVCLGGDPIYTYCATAPLPDGVDEYLLAGFLRKKAMRLVKCLTNELWVPADCDFVIEGYVDTAEPKFMEGPFGDHTGFYSMEDLYPYFHVTAITRRRDAVYPATVVGIPPAEDFQIAVATEKIFLEPLRLMMPEIVDMHMPAAGVAHNLAIVSIRKTYSGQAFKVATALWGAGQMMFNKVLVIVPEEVSVRDYGAIMERLRGVDIQRDVLLSRGVADVLDHAAVDGQIGKLAVDLTETCHSEAPPLPDCHSEALPLATCHSECGEAESKNLVENMRSFDFAQDDNLQSDPSHSFGMTGGMFGMTNINVLMDDAVRELPPEDQLWHVLANLDPARDVTIVEGVLSIDGRTKAGYPPVIVSSPETIALVDARWAEYGLGEFVASPSRKYQDLEIGVEMSFRSE